MKIANQIHCEILGDQKLPVLLMLHGWGHSHVKLSPMGNLLKEKFRVHIFDLPGFGKSPLPKESASPETAWGTYRYAQAIIEYMDKNNIADASILGHSFGGTICLQLAGNFPERINDVILIDAAGLKPIITFKSRIRLGKIKLTDAVKHVSKIIVGKNMYQKLRDWRGSRHASAEVKIADELKQVFIKAVNENLEDDAKAIKKNTLILWGEYDRVTPLYMAKLLNQFIVNSTLILMKNKGHEPFSGSGLQLCVSHIINFLNNGKNV